MNTVKVVRLEENILMPNPKRIKSELMCLTVLLAESVEASTQCSSYSPEHLSEEGKLEVLELVRHGDSRSSVGPESCPSLCLLNLMKYLGRHL